MSAQNGRIPGPYPPLIEQATYDDGAEISHRFVNVVPVW